MVTAELLKTTVSGANSVPEYLLQAGEVERERLRVRSKEINSTSTYRQSKTTQIYARVTPKKLFEDMDRFVEATRDLKLIL